MIIILIYDTILVIINSNFQDKYSTYFNQFSSIEESDKQLFVELFTIMFNKIDIRTQEKLIYRAKLIHEIICNEEKSNSALLCFKIIYMAFIYKYNSSNLSWIFKINKSSYPIAYEKIGTEVMNFLQKLESSVVVHGSTTSLMRWLGKSYKHIENRLPDKMFWIFASLYKPINNDKYCFDYFCKEPNMLKNEVELAKKFDNLAKIMK